jgi:hypothetical protein
MPTLTKIGRLNIQDNAISSATLEDGSVAAVDIGADAVGTSALNEGHSYQMVNLTTTGNVSTTGTTLSKGALTVGDSSANTNFTIPATRGTEGKVLAYPASGTTLTWSEVSVSGYNGVAWFYKVSSAQTIPVNKAIVVPGPLEIASGGTVTVQGRLHVI